MDEKKEIASRSKALETPLFSTIESMWPRFSSTMTSVRVPKEKILMLVLWCLDGLKDDEDNYHLQNMWFNLNNHLMDFAYENRTLSANNEECDKVTNIVLAFAIDCLEWSNTIELSNYYNMYYSPVRKNPTIIEHFDEIKKYIQAIKKDIIKWHRGPELKVWLADYFENDVFYTTEEFEWDDSEADSNAPDNIQIGSNENPTLASSIDNLSNSLNLLSIQNTITTRRPQMPPYIIREEAIEIYNFLINGNYIASDTSSEDFLYLMGVTANASDKIKLISWQKTVQQLRRFVELAYRDPIKRQSIKLADIERRVPLCFLNKDKKMTVLAKATQENSLDLDAIEEFFRQK